MPENPIPQVQPTPAPGTEAPVAPLVTPVVVAAPVAETAPVAPVVAPEAPVVAEVAPAAETVIGEALTSTVEAEKPKEEIKPPEKVEPKVEATENKTTEGQSEEPAPPPTYEPFTVPEGITLDQERVGKLTELLSDLEVNGKADHAIVQQFGQKAVDFHVQELQRAVEDVTKLYQTTWERQKVEWKDSFLKDPEIGGNRFQTTVDAARNFIRTHGGTVDQQTEFRNVMESSGLGNHPAVIRLLANAGMAMKEGTPLAAAKPVSQPKSKTATLYGNGSS